jgi:photosynthetic reaction center H subunit
MSTYDKNYEKETHGAGTTHEENKKRLFRLDELDKFEVAENDPDVRGWDVVGADGDKLGTVEELIVDPEARKVRYLDIHVINELSSAGGERHLLIPIGAAAVNEKDDNVWIREIDKDTLKRYPIYSGGPVTRDYEHSLREVLRSKQDQDTETMKEDDDFFYNNETFNQDRFFRNKGYDA